MNTKYQIFVSSTYEDLKEERKEVSQAILECNCFPAGMELFPASNRSQWEVIKKVIDESDFYIVIIAGRYGSIGVDDYNNKVSYTEMEFDYAVKEGKPIIALVYDDIGNLPRSKTENTSTKQNKLQKFRDKVCTDRLIKKWTNKDNLKAAALAAINALKNHTDALGWVRAGSKTEQSAYEMLTEQRKDYESQIDILKSQLLVAQEKEKKTDKMVIGLKNSMEELETRFKQHEYEVNGYRAELRKHLHFWTLLAQINLEFAYFNKERSDLATLLKENFEVEISEYEEFFLKMYKEPNLWSKVTCRALEIRHRYFKMSFAQRVNFWDSIKTDLADYIPGRDCYVASDEEFTALFGLAFAIEYLRLEPATDDMHELVAKTRDEIIMVCNEFVSELWEIECALSENDY